MANDAFVAFWSGMMVGAIIGIILFSVILAIRANDFRKEKEHEEQ